MVVLGIRQVFDIDWFRFLLISGILCREVQKNLLPCQRRNRTYLDNMGAASRILFLLNAQPT